MCIHHRQELVPAVQDVIDSGVLPVLKKLLISEESEDELILRVINLLEGLAGGTLDQLRVVVDEELLQQLAPICRFRFQEFYYDIPEGVSSLLEAACFTCMREGDRAFLNRAMEFMVPLADFKPKVTASFMCRIVIMWNKKFKFSSLVVTEFFPRFFDWLSSADKWMKEDICQSMKYVAYDQKAARMAFDSGVLPKVVNLLDANHGEHAEDVFAVLNWFARFYPEEVSDACFPRDRSLGLYAKVADMTVANRWSEHRRILDLLTKLLKKGHAKVFYGTDWIPYLVKAAQLPEIRELQEQAQGEPDAGKIDDLPEYVRRHMEFRACHLIAKITLDTLQSKPAEVARLVKQGVIVPLCRYLKHEPNTHVPLHGRWPPVDDDEYDEYNISEDDCLISSPLLALVGIFHFGALDKYQRHQFVNKYGRDILAAGGIEGARTFKGSCKPDYAEQAGFFLLQLEAMQASLSA